MNLLDNWLANTIKTAVMASFFGIGGIYIVLEMCSRTGYCAPYERFNDTIVTGLFTFMTELPPPLMIAVIGGFWYLFFWGMLHISPDEASK